MEHACLNLKCTTLHISAVCTTAACINNFQGVRRTAQWVEFATPVSHLGDSSTDGSEDSSVESIPVTPNVETVSKSVLKELKVATRKRSLGDLGVPVPRYTDGQCEVMPGLLARIAPAGGTDLVADPTCSITVPIEWQSHVHQRVVAPFRRRRFSSSHWWRQITEAALKALTRLYHLLKLSVKLPIRLPKQLVRGQGCFRDKISLDQFMDRNPEPIRAMLRHVSSQFQMEKCEVCFPQLLHLLLFLLCCMSLICSAPTYYCVQLLAPRPLQGPSFAGSRSRESEKGRRAHWSHCHRDGRCGTASLWLCCMY